MRLLQYDSGGTNVRRLYWLNHVLANLSVINVLTGSHSSGRGNRTARHRLAPPAMLTDDSWATGKWQQQKRPACSCSFLGFFQHSNGQFISYINAVIVIIMPIFVLLRWLLWLFFLIPPPPHRSPFWFYCLFFWSNLENVVRSHFVLNGCELSLNLCISVTYVRVRVCVCVRLCCAVVDV